MLKIIAIVIGVFVAGVLILAATRPDNFRVQRQVIVKAPADKVLPLITDLRGWSAWSPYEKKDPAMKRMFGGAERGKGATYAWDGNKEVGAGSLEITDGPLPFVSKVVCLFLNMDKLVGADFEAGLASLKALAEK